MSLDIDNVIIWNKFKENFLLKLDDIPPFEVDLAFEYKEVNGSIVSYSSGDELYFCDVKFTGDGTICLEIPHGTQSRFLSLNYVDSISHPDIGMLEDFLGQCYLDAIKDFTANGITVPATIDDFSNSIKSKKGNVVRETINILNNSGEYLQKTIEAERNKVTFQKMEEFGMF